MTDDRRLVVAVTGATGAPLAVRLLERLQAIPGVTTDLVVSRWGRATVQHETGMSVRELGRLADRVYDPSDQSAPISSGSVRTDGMVVVPCSMKTLAGIRTGYAEDLICRAADVTLKEHRRLVLVTRETPLSEIHLDNMAALARMGAVILPPVLGFYQRPTSVAELVDHLVIRILDQFDLPTPDAPRWDGFTASGAEDGSNHDSLATEPKRSSQR